VIRHLWEYSLPAFNKEFIASRPDLVDVRGYNREMIGIFSGLYEFTGKTLLDIGASPHGFALERALEIGVRQYCGVGLGVQSDVLVREGAQAAVLMKMDADRLDIASDSFDAIISLSTFEHFFHPDQVLKEMHRIVKAGGRVLLNFQPVWTSARGHHLHHMPDVCTLLPKWAHLKWSREEMLENLRSSWPASASMRLEEVVHWIYDSDEINRLSGSALRQALETSLLEVQWITPLKDAADSAEAESASKTLPYSADELATKGYSALLAKR
jgi:ubiquinone/menaquinone biosynthesis C-methylase UbiE